MAFLPVTRSTRRPPAGRLVELHPRPAAELVPGDTYISGGPPPVRHPRSRVKNREAHGTPGRTPNLLRPPRLPPLITEIPLRAASGISSSAPNHPRSSYDLAFGRSEGSARRSNGSISRRSASRGWSGRIASTVLRASSFLPEERSRAGRRLSRSSGRRPSRLPGARPPSNSSGARPGSGTWSTRPPSGSRSSTARSDSATSTRDSWRYSLRRAVTQKWTG